MVLLVKPMTVTKAAKTMSAVKSMKAENAMRAMKTKPTTMSAYEAYSTTAEMVGLAPTQVKDIVEVMMALAATQVQSVGSFKLAGAIGITLKKKTATAARKGVHPITKEPCLFKAKKASQKWRIIAMKKFVLMVMFADYLIV